MFQPRVSFNGSFASVSIVVQQFFTCLNVPGSYEDEMRHTIDVVQLGLTIATLAVINEPPQPIRFFRSIDTERARTEGGIVPGTGAPCWAKPKEGGIHTSLENLRTNRTLTCYITEQQP